MVVEPLPLPQMDDLLETTLQHHYDMQCLLDRLLWMGMLVLQHEKENMHTGHQTTGQHGDDGIGLYHLGTQANVKNVHI